MVRLAAFVIAQRVLWILVLAVGVKLLPVSLPLLTVTGQRWQAWPACGWLDPLLRFDALVYLEQAAAGPGSAAASAAPAYTLLVAHLGRLVGIPAAALLTAELGVLAAVLCVHRLAAPEARGRTVLAALAHPACLLLVIADPAALALGGLAMAVLGMCERHPLLAFFGSLLAALSAPGLALVLGGVVGVSRADVRSRLAVAAAAGLAALWLWGLAGLPPWRILGAGPTPDAPVLLGLSAVLAALALGAGVLEWRGGARERGAVAVLLGVAPLLGATPTTPCLAFPVWLWAGRALHDERLRSVYVPAAALVGVLFTLPWAGGLAYR